LSSLSPRQRARFERELEKQQRFTDEAKDQLDTCAFRRDVLKNEIMASHTSLGVGGAADALITVRDVNTLREVMEFAAAKNVPYVFLGQGNSTLFKDGGFRGMVIRLKGSFEHISAVREDEEHVYVEVPGAASVQALAGFLTENRLEGADVLAGMNGTVAGRISIYPNWLADIAMEARIVDRNAKELTLARKAFVCDGKMKFPRTNAILSVQFRFARMKNDASVGLSDEPTQEERPVLKGIFRDTAGQTASSVISDVGLAGVRVGHLRVDREDPNTFVNEGSDRAKDALVLISMIRDRVKEKTNIVLDTAIRIVGED